MEGARATAAPTRHLSVAVPASLLSACCLSVTLAVYVVLAYLYAIHVPIWNAPDEPAHYNYVRHIATTGTLPVLQPGDYDVNRVERLMSLKFPAAEPVDWMRYESHQPPLYYTIAAPLFQLTASAEGTQSLREQVVALRLLSTAFGAALIVVCFFLVREVAPDSPALQRFVPAFVAFVPMHVAMSAAINNDTLAELLVALTLLVLVGALRRGMSSRRAVGLGVLLGLILLTKLVAYGVALVTVVGVFAAVRLHRAPGDSPWRRSLGYLLVIGAIAGVLSGWWFARNALVYGNLDVFGLRQHDLIVVGQPLTGPIDGAAVQRFVQTTFRSFWGQFGWMAAPLSDRHYRVLALATAVAAAGLLAYAFRVLRGRALIAPWRRWGALLLVLTAALVLGQMIVYNLTYLQLQGRYLFPALLALAVLFGVGWREAWRLAGAPLGRASLVANLMLALWAVGLAALTLLALFRVVVPYYNQ